MIFPHVYYNSRVSKSVIWCLHMFVSLCLFVLSINLIVDERSNQNLIVFAVVSLKYEEGWSCKVQSTYSCMHASALLSHLNVNHCAYLILCHLIFSYLTLPYTNLIVLTPQASAQCVWRKCHWTPLHSHRAMYTSLTLDYSSISSAVQLPTCSRNRKVRESMLTLVY